MTTQHTPQTPPMWRKFLSLPQTGIGWWAVGLAAPALVLTVYFLLPAVFGWTFLRPEGVVVLADYTILLLAWPLSALFGGVVGLLAVARDRSLLVWVAQVPALHLFTVLIGLSFFYEGSPWVPFLISVSFWAVMNFGIIWSNRDLRERRSS